jgi:hypothetical protein
MLTTLKQEVEHMVDIIINNLATIIAVVIIVGCLTLAIRKMIRDKKSGKTCCSGSCGGCSAAGKCHKK